MLMDPDDKVKCVYTAGIYELAQFDADPTSGDYFC